MKQRSAIALPLADRSRLARILGMLGSDYPGERDNAARLADQFIRDRGTTWPDILAAPLDDIGSRPQPSTGDPLAYFDTIEACCEFILAHTPLINIWERTFVTRLPGFARLSEKQLAIVRRLIDRAIAAGAVP